MSDLVNATTTGTKSSINRLYKLLKSPLRLPLLMFKISSTPSPMSPPLASDVGIHILGQEISDKQH
jgi:hypothetical protein